MRRLGDSRAAAERCARLPLYKPELGPWKEFRFDKWRFNWKPKQNKAARWRAEAEAKNK